MFSDLRFALRQLLKSPGFTATALITLALGIGACTAIFSVVNSVLLRPLPYPESENLVTVIETKLPEFPQFSVSPGNYFSWQERTRSFEHLAAARGDSHTLTGRGEPTRLNALRVTANYLSTLRLQPVLGRDFRAEEDAPGAETVVLLSHAFWQQHFGGDSDVVGQTMLLDGRAFTIVGVLPAALRESDVITPAAYTAEDRQQHGGHYIRVIGRLRDGVTRAAAETELRGIARQLEQEFPDTNTRWSVNVSSLLDATVGDVRPVLYALLGAVGFLLLIACANVANLLLARASARTKEMAIRAAQGAGPARIIRQLLTESVVLAAFGGILGALIARWGVQGLLALAPENLPRADEIAVDTRALWFTCAIAVITGVVFGLAPALQAARVDLNVALKETARGAGSGRHGLRHALVVAEVAIALVLLIGAGLLIRSFARLNAVDPGFEPRGAYTVALDLAPQRYGERTQQAAFVDQAIERLAAIPGVETVGATHVLPFSGNDYNLAWYREDLPRPKAGEFPGANYYAATPDYFRAMGVPLRRGRLFSARDATNAPRVAIINETLARRFFGDTDPIGKRIHITNSEETWREIVGIVGDTKHYALDGEPLAQMYEPFAQVSFPFLSFVIRAPDNPPGLAAAVRAALRGVDPDQPIFRFAAMEDLLTQSVARQRFSMTLFAAFSGVALLLAAIGIYGVMAYAVVQRTGEIGIRMALGAQRGNVLGLILAQGGRLIALGLVCGVAGAFGLMRFLDAMLYDVGVYDPLTFVSIAALLAAVAALACFIPARRATKVDPLVALRAE